MFMEIMGYNMGDTPAGHCFLLRDFVLQNVACDKFWDRRTQFFGGWRYPTEAKISNFWSCREAPSTHTQTHNSLP